MALTSSKALCAVSSDQSTAAIKLVTRLATVATPTKKRDTAQTYRAIQQDIKACNKSKGSGKHVVIWKEVWMYMVEKDPVYMT